MADIARPTPSVSGRHGARRQQSRLQSRAPASLQISPAAEWKVAIPLLSPLVSPSSEPHQLPEIASRPDDQRRHAAEPDKPSPAAAAFKKWQHPAAPFCCEPAPPVRPFVPV